MPILNPSRTVGIVSATLLSLSLLGAGCGQTPSMIDSNTNTINLQNQDGGGLSAGDAAQIPANFPAQYPRYQNAKTTLAYTDQDGKTGSLAQETSDSIAQVQSSVESTMQAQGFTKEQSFPGSNDVVILSYVKGSTHCQVNITRQGTTTRIQSACSERAN